MNTSKRQELTDRINKVGVIVWIEVSIFNSTELEEKKLQLKDLSDKEISDLSSSVLWGMKEGLIMSDDRDCLVKWIKK